MKSRPDKADYREEIQFENGSFDNIFLEAKYFTDLEKYIDHLESKDKWISVEDIRYVASFMDWLIENASVASGYTEHFSNSLMNCQNILAKAPKLPKEKK